MASLAGSKSDITVQDALDAIIHCDYEYCEDLMELTMDALILHLEKREPELADQMDSCMRGLIDVDVCKTLFDGAISKYEATIDQLINNHRQLIDPYALQGYDGKRYASPFWFEGSGDIWRKMTHQQLNKPLVSIEDCKKIRQDVQQCLADPTYPTEVCFRQYGHAITCEPGLNCPYLRLPLMQCLQNQHLVDFKQVKDCVQNVPNYSPCIRGYVAPEGSV